MNKLFDEPMEVFNERMLKPELQSMEDYVDGIRNIVEAQKKVALNYFEEGSIDAAILPLKILLHIMAYGHYEGKELNDPEIRREFEREHVIKSAWYSDRLKLRQENETKFLLNRIAYLQDFMAEPNNQLLVEKMNLHERLEKVKAEYNHVKSDNYLNELVGTIGSDPLFRRS